MDSSALLFVFVYMFIVMDSPAWSTYFRYSKLWTVQHGHSVLYIGSYNGQLWTVQPGSIFIVRDHKGWVAMSP
jgi:hypothetical protein